MARFLPRLEQRQPEVSGQPIAAIAEIDIIRESGVTMESMIRVPSVGVPAQGGVAAAPAGEDAALEVFFREHLETGFRLRPSTATGLGDHRYDDQLDDVSTAARARWAEQTRTTLEALPRRVDYKIGRASWRGRV